MLDWFRSGYFTLNLLVRRGCDERYSQLGDLIKMWGRLPFMQGPVMPALKVNAVIFNLVKSININFYSIKNLYGIIKIK